ncbi:Detected protein of unknown function [Hibiscus syriacus]|uniref:Uncharacterized protein n=2 Tax=Hibiscus syriacus TaxID=106335 RepID=A0A6A3BKD0_HIBSY|nr:Detected protein of unknown function [Hibiscus syriacus]
MRSREELQGKFKKYVSRPRSKAELRSKLRHYMSKPVRALHRARDFYVKSLEDCASKVGGHDGLLGCPAPQVSRLPKSFNFNYSKSNNDEKFMNFLETMSKKRSMESDVQEREEEPRHVEDRHGGFNRSYSTIAGLGRIDEDEPCYFEEEDAVYARSRSCVYKRCSYY